MLIATIVDASLIPFKCCPAPDTPTPIYKFPLNVWPLIPTYLLMSTYLSVSATGLDDEIDAPAW